MSYELGLRQGLIVDEFGEFHAAIGVDTFYRELTNSLPQIIWMQRLGDGEAIYFNDHFKRYYGEIGTGQKARRDCNHPEDEERIRDAYEKAISTKQPTEVEARLRRIDGKYLWHKLIARPIVRGGRAIGFIGLALEIDEIVDSRERIQRNEERLGLALEAAGAALWDFDFNTNVLWYSDQWYRNLGYEPGELAPNLDAWRSISDSNDFHSLSQKLKACATGEVPDFTLELRLKRKNGSWAWALAQGKSVGKPPGDPYCRVIGTQIDISPRKIIEQRFAYLATHDSLTGLPSRTFFRSHLDRCLRTRHCQENLISVLYIDLDFFKSINDTLGHQAGDDLLKEVARRMKGMLRAGDFLARLGGDEFALVLENSNRKMYSIEVARRLISGVQAPFFLAGQFVQVGLSIGIAFASEEDVDGENILRRADKALYKSKAAGKNTFKVARSSARLVSRIPVGEN